MIRLFTRLPIRRKLIAMIMATSLAVVVLASIGYIVADYYTSRNDLEGQVTGQATLIFENVEAALAFDDPKSAQMTLDTLSSVPNIRAACLYSEKGALFTGYYRQDSRPCEPTLPESADGVRVVADRVIVTRSHYGDTSGKKVGTLVVRSDLAALERRFRQQAFIVLALLFATASVAMAMSSRLQALVSDPILALSRTASEVSSRGDYSLRAVRKSEDELGTLVDAFNRMLERIQLREEELSKANEDLRTEIGERKRAEQERAELLVREREANRLKDEFLATLSHELRTPLNAILGWTKLLRSNAVPPGSQERALEKVERNALVQARLVDDLLEVSRITTGKLRLEVRPFDLVALANTAIDSIKPTAEARGVSVERDFDAPSLQTGGDPDRLQQVIWNLLTNAVKFTPPGGRVTISLRRQGPIDEIKVSDTGIGIDQAFLPNVFETFRQADASSTRTHGGLGLGLSIVRHLVEMHAGTVQAASPGRGQGATFTVQLPVRTTGRDAPGVSPVRSRHAIEGMLDGISVLAVEDDSDTRELLQSALLAAGARVHVAANAIEALSACLNNHPDAIVSDIGMPGRDGYMLIQDIQAALGTRSPRVAIALSAYASPQDRDRAINAGFHRHMAKPVDPEELIRTLHSLLTGFPART